MDKILVLAPHTDDAEFGCGATIDLLNKAGHEIFVATFSSCEQSVRSIYPVDILKQEYRSSMEVLNVKNENIFLYSFEVRKFNYQRQEILEILIDLKNKIDPDIIFMPSLNDIHQDHQVIANEGLRAFKNKTMYSYEMPWNNLNFNNSAYFVLEEENINVKLNALLEYKSQSHRPYWNKEFIYSLAKVRGVQINETFAEVFETVRIVNKKL